MGTVLAVGVGPITMACIQRTVGGGLRVGLCMGLGAAVADLFFAAVVVLSLSPVHAFFEDNAAWLQLVAATVLVTWGLKVVFTKPKLRPRPDGLRAVHAAGAFGSGLALNLVNPWNLLAYGLLGAKLGVAGDGQTVPGAICFMAGVFCGSMIWWSLVTAGAGALRQRVMTGLLLTFNRVTGSAIALCGLVLFLR